MTIDTDNIKKTAYRVYDSVNECWNKYAFWTKASQVEFDDGQTAEQKLGSFKGIKNDASYSSSSTAASGYAVDASCVASVNAKIAEWKENYDALQTQSQSASDSLGGCIISRDSTSGKYYIQYGTDSDTRKLLSGGTLTKAEVAQIEKAYQDNEKGSHDFTYTLTDDDKDTFTNWKDFTDANFSVEGGGYYSHNFTWTFTEPDAVTGNYNIYAAASVTGYDATKGVVTIQINTSGDYSNEEWDKKSITYSGKLYVHYYA